MGNARSLILRTVAVAAVAAAAVLAAPLAPARADEGESIFKKRCLACHTAEPGKHKVGPSLAGVYGRKAGSTDFKQYRGMKQVKESWEWDEKLLDEYLSDPKEFLVKRGAKTTTMTFKLTNAKERKEVIEYLKKQSK